MNHQSNEVKQLLARVCSYLARREINSPELLKSVIPMLVNGKKEKNSYVKANSELSLVAVLRLRIGDDKLQVSYLTNYVSSYYSVFSSLFYFLFVNSICIKF